MASEMEQRLQASEAIDRALSQYCEREALLNYLSNIKGSALSKLDCLHSITSEISQGVAELYAQLCFLQLDHSKGV